MSKVKIVARIRPFLPTETADDSVTTEGDSISLRDSRNSAQRLVYKEFAACYDYASNNPEESKDLFNVEIGSLLTGVYQGKTIAIMCYGVTSSGKTTTMQGNDQVPGIVARSVEKILQGPLPSIAGADVDYQFSMQYFEIYCDDCYDLLAPSGTSTKLPLREDTNGRVNVANLSSHQFLNMAEFHSLIRRATKARRTAATASNRLSSRSHAILKVTVFQAPPRRLSLTHLPRMLGRIEFVDLAGSERNKSLSSGVDSGPAPKTRMAESASINKSLSALSRVVTALNNGSTVIPYRDSSLTRVLKDALGGKSITLLICNIAPGAKWLSHTRATIEFATKAKTIKSAPKPLGDDESKRRAEHKRHVDAEFNLAVEAEVARRLAALTDVLPQSSKDALAPVPPTVSEITPAQEARPLRAPSPPPARASSPPRSDSGELQGPIGTDLITQDGQGQDEVEPPPFFEEPPEAPVFFDDPPEVPDYVEGPPINNAEDRDTAESRAEGERIAHGKTSRSKERPLPRKQVRDAPELSRVKPPSERPRDDAKEQHAEDAKERYRRKLTKGLKQKHEKYRSDGQPVDRYKFARACIIAGKMALEEHDDVELAISMFEKAISWYPENERLLEETLKLKKRLRGDPENGEGSDQRSLSSGKTSSNPTTTLKPLASARKANMNDDKVQRRQIFQFDVEKEEAAHRKQREKESHTKKKKETKSKSRGGNIKVTGAKGKAKGKGKGRAVIEAAAAAFADSDVEEVEEIEDPSQDSEAEVERSLQAEHSDAVPSPSPVKAKSERKGRKRKSACSDDEEYDNGPGSEPQAAKGSPPKRRRIIF